MQNQTSRSKIPQLLWKLWKRSEINWCLTMFCISLSSTPTTYQTDTFQINLTPFPLPTLQPSPLIYPFLYKNVTSIYSRFSHGSNITIIQILYSCSVRCRSTSTTSSKSYSLSGIPRCRSRWTSSRARSRAFATNARRSSCSSPSFSSCRPR